MIIVNFSTHQYYQGQIRLANSIKGYETLMFDDYKQIGSPTHQESPYEFKVHAIEKALEKDPIVLWMDSSMKVVGDLSVIENIIKTDGYFMEEAGHYAGRWTNQHTRNYFNLTEQEAKQGEGGITMFSAGLLGLNSQSPIAMDFFKQWKASALAGCFRGDWQDHRHDMTCASIIATRLGMKYQSGGTYMAYIGPGYSQPKESVIIHCIGL